MHIGSTTYDKTTTVLAEYQVLLAKRENPSTAAIQA
jgi:hypothetical protein